MRALVCTAYGSTDQLEVQEMDDPVPGEGQVLVDVKAASINFADVLAIAGKYQVKSDPPFVPGAEAAGVIEAVGPGVDQHAVGDRVMVSAPMGCFAEKCVVDQGRARPILPGLDFAQAAAFNIAYGTTYHAFRQSGNLQAGDSLLVLGAAGGVGIAAVEMGKAFGARVIAAASSDEKLAFAKAAGADELINYSDTPLKETVKEMTDGDGVNVVYDPVGGELAQQAFRALAWQGRYLVIGFADGEIPKMPANIALLKEASIIGVWWGAWAGREPQAQAQNVADMGEMIEQGKLKLRVETQHPLDEYAEAFGALMNRKAMGKVVLTMD